MKVLHFLTNINTGGAEKFCVDLCNTQAAVSGNEIYLCVLGCITEDQPLASMVSSDVSLVSLNKEGGYSLKMIYKIYRLISEIKPDVIHANGTSLAYASISIIKKSIPTIYTVHTMADKELSNKIRKYYNILFNYFPKIFTPVAISQTVLETVRKRYGIQFNEMIYNGSSEPVVSKESESVHNFLESLKENKNTLVFLYIGRVREVKNTLLLVQAFNRLLDNGENICLCIIGYDNSPNQSYLLKCENENRYPDKIKFVGRKENIADFLLYADASCLTSNYEGLGIAALEAFSMGVPVITTPSGGPAELIVSGINGYVSKQIDLKSYIEVLKKFIKKPLKYKTDIKKIYKEKYTMDVCAFKYLELYKKKYIEIK